MKLAIIGSRTFDDFNLLEKSVFSNFNKQELDLIISGGADGADSLAEKFAEKYHIDKLVRYPKVDKYHKGAYHIRNQQIVDDCDALIAFWDGKSPGTKSTIAKINKTHKNSIIILF